MFSCFYKFLKKLGLVFFHGGILMFDGFLCGGDDFFGEPYISRRLECGTEVRRSACKIRGIFFMDCFSYGEGSGSYFVGAGNGKGFSE